MAILAVVSDLLFRSKIEAGLSTTDRPVVFSDGSGAWPSPPAGDAWRLILLDLNLSDDPIPLIGRLQHLAPEARLIGYCSHTQTELSERALRAGCTDVWPRSVFVQRLPTLPIA